MKGQIISDWKITRLITRRWMHRMIQMPTTVRNLEYLYIDLGADGVDEE